MRNEQQETIWQKEMDAVECGGKLSEKECEPSHWASAFAA